MNEIRTLPFRKHPGSSAISHAINQLLLLFQHRNQCVFTLAANLKFIEFFRQQNQVLRLSIAMVTNSHHSAQQVGPAEPGLTLVTKWKSVAPAR